MDNQGIVSIGAGSTTAASAATCAHAADVLVDTHSLRLVSRSGFGNASGRGTSWHRACRVCHAAVLHDGPTSEPALPFRCDDGVMRTLADYQGTAHDSMSIARDFCGLRFTDSALYAAMALIRLEDGRVHEHAVATVEKLGRDYLAQPDAQSAGQLSEAVCAWGGGSRVWGNLVRHHGKSLGAKFHAWFTAIGDTRDAETAIAPALANDSQAGIKGLGVSFASKHLRMLRPDCFAVLDDVLSTGLGFALNIKGYALFMHHLHSFVSVPPGNIAVGRNLGAVEGGIFYLVRPWVRAR